VKYILYPYCPLRHLVSAMLLVVILTGSAFAQKEDKIKAILKQSEIKKIEKADLSIGSTDTLMKEANRLNNEVAVLKENSYPDDKTKMKQIKQLDRKAWKNITAASDLYRDRNSVKYKIYKTYIEKFWLDFEGDEASYEEARKIEEQSNDLYFQAGMKRASANEMPTGNDRIQELKQAIVSENMAIDMQLTVLGVYYGIDLTDKKAEPVMATQAASPVAVAETDVEINSGQPQPGIQQGAAVTQEPATEQTLAAAAVVGTETVAVASVTDARSEQQPALQQEPEKQNAAAVSESQSAQADPDVEFRIQLAASRTTLTKENIAKLCPKPCTIARSEENGWYKYYIAAGNSYEQAKKVMRECGAEKAFIVPYKNGQKITVAEASKTNP